MKDFSSVRSSSGRKPESPNTWPNANGHGVSTDSSQYSNSPESERSDFSTVPNEHETGASASDRAATRWGIVALF